MSRARFALLLVLVALSFASCGPVASPTLAPTATTEPTAAPTATPSPEPVASPTPVPSATPIPPTPTPTPTPTGPWVVAIPNHASPGKLVTLEGYIPGGPTASIAKQDLALASANACWQSCLTGFVENDRAVQWSADEPGRFQTSFLVPPIPWLGSEGPVPLTPGNYTIWLQCLAGELSGCALKEGGPTADFELETPVPTLCQPGNPCAELSLSPPAAAPGATVALSGWAPLVELFGETPSGYDLVMHVFTQTTFIGQIGQSLDGTISGTFTVPFELPTIGLIPTGTYTVALQAGSLQLPRGGITVATAPFEVLAPPSWSGLTPGQPLQIVPAASLIPKQLAVDPGMPGRIAYCTGNEIRVSDDSGQTWRSIPTGPVSELATSLGYPIFTDGTSGDSPCHAVTLDAAHPDSFFAIFEAAKAPYGAPPVFYMGYATTDAGTTWQPVPAPASSDSEAFGGYWTDGQGVVQALFNSLPVPGSQEGPQAVVMQTTDGGQTWNEASLVCPAQGACIRWGPAPGSIPGMGSPLPQRVYASTDDGQTWRAPGPSVELRFPSPSELVLLPQDAALLISGDADFPLLMSDDGGQTWNPLGLPALPGGGGSFLFDGLQMAPDGSLVGLGGGGQTWMLLGQGSSAWCEITAQPLPSSVVLLQPSADQLWWLAPDGTSVLSVPTGSIGCGG